MPYTPHQWEVGDVITAERLNDIESGIQEAAESGGGYDIIISTTEFDSESSHYTVEHMDWASVKAKVLAGELVTGMLYIHYNYDEYVDGDTNVDLVPLVGMNVNSLNSVATFEQIYPNISNSNTQLTAYVRKVNVIFNLQTGAISNVNVALNKTVSLS